MSGQAVHRIIMYGPEDVELAWLLVVVADWMGADGDDGHVGVRTIADRSRTTFWRARRLLEQAVDEGWLSVDKPGGPRRAAVYSLGPALVGGRVTRGKPRAARGSRAQNRALTRESDAQNRTQTSDVVGRKRTSRSPRQSGGSSPGDNQPSPRVSRHPPSCVCGGSGWVSHNGTDEVARCPGPDSDTDPDRSSP